MAGGSRSSRRVGNGAPLCLAGMSTGSEVFTGSLRGKNLSNSLPLVQSARELTAVAVAVTVCASVMVASCVTCAVSVTSCCCVSTFVSRMVVGSVSTAVSTRVTASVWVTSCCSVWVAVTAIVTGWA